MLHVSLLQSAQDADTLAGLVVRVLQEGDIRRAVELSIHFCTKFHPVAENHALHAGALSRLPADAATTLKARDMALLRDTFQPHWLAKALRLAWAVGNTEFFARWTALLEHVFLAAPPVALRRSWKRKAGKAWVPWAFIRGNCAAGHGNVLEPYAGFAFPPRSRSAR